MAILPLFDRKTSKVEEFVIACKLYLIKGSIVEEQIQWILTYVQGKSADV